MKTNTWEPVVSAIASVVDAATRGRMWTVWDMMVDAGMVGNPYD